MKTAKRVFTMLLALVMALCLGLTAFAEDTNYTITVKNDTESTNLSINGKTFNAYKIFDATYTGDKETDAHAYTIVGSGEKKSAWFDKVQEYANKENSGLTLTATAADKTLYNVTIDEDKFSARDFGDYLGQWLNGLTENQPAVNGTATGVAVEGSTTEEQAVFNNLPGAGYYLVTGEGTADGNVTVYAAAALYTTDPKAEIDIKAAAPTIDKQVKSDEADFVDSTTASIGDTVTYEITSEVPDMTGYSKYYFVVDDTMSKGLTFNENSVKVTVGNQELVQGTETDYTGKGYYVTTEKVKDKDDKETGETAIKIVFVNFLQYKEAKDSNITVTYSATINEYAAIGAAGNGNSATLTYSTNPNVTPTSGKDDNHPDEPKTPDPENPNTPYDPTGTTPSSTAYTYVTGIELTKIDNENTYLAGATFTVKGDKVKTVLVKKDVYTESDEGTYYKLKDNSYTETAPTEATADKYASTTTKYTKEVVTEEKVTSDTVTATGTTGADGVLRFEGLAAGTYTISEIKAPTGYNLLTEDITLVIECEAPAENSTSTDCTWQVGTNSTSADDWTVSDDGVFKLSVVNQKGNELPSTGGIGTTVFYVVGGILVVGAAVLLVTKRRMRKFED